MECSRQRPTPGRKARRRPGETEARSFRPHPRLAAAAAARTRRRHSPPRSRRPRQRRSALRWSCRLSWRRDPPATENRGTTSILALIAVCRRLGRGRSARVSTLSIWTCCKPAGPAGYTSTTHGVCSYMICCICQSGCGALAAESSCRRSARRTACRTPGSDQAGSLVSPICQRSSARHRLARDLRSPASCQTYMSKSGRQTVLPLEVADMRR